MVSPRCPETGLKERVYFSNGNKVGKEKAQHRSMKGEGVAASPDLKTPRGDLGTRVCRTDRRDAPGRVFLGMKGTRGPSTPKLGAPGTCAETRAGRRSLRRKPIRSVTPSRGVRVDTYRPPPANHSGWPRKRLGVVGLRRKRGAGREHDSQPRNVIGPGPLRNFLLVLGTEHGHYGSAHGRSVGGSRAVQVCPRLARRR